MSHKLDPQKHPFAGGAFRSRCDTDDRFAKSIFAYLCLKNQGSSVSAKRLKFQTCAPVTFLYHFRHDTESLNRNETGSRTMKCCERDSSGAFT